MRLTSLVAVLCAWFAASFCLESRLLPSPWAVFSNFAGSILTDPIIEREGGGEDGFSVHCLATFGRLSLSLCVGCVLGLFIATLSWSQGQFSKFVTAGLDLIRSLPPLILVPFFLILFRTAEQGILFAIVTYCTMNFAFYWREAFSEVPPAFVDRAILCGISAATLWRTVLVPSSMPIVLAGFKVSISLTLGIVIVAEYIGASDGLGRVLKYGVSYSSAVIILTCAVWASLLAVAFELVLDFAIRRTRSTLGEVVPA